MKTLSQLLSEAPIADDDFQRYSETPKTKTGEYTDDFPSKHAYKLLKKNYGSVGYGSSRVAFQCDVPVKLFTKEHRQQFKIGKAGFYRTVIKIAKNPEGIQQNTAELKFFNELQHLPSGKFLCPVLDWSGNPTYQNDSQYTLDINNYNIDVNMAGDLKGALWIQMPLVLQADDHAEEFMEAFTKTFGPINYDKEPDEVDDTGQIIVETIPTPRIDHGIQMLMCMLSPHTYPVRAHDIEIMRQHLFETGELSEAQDQAMEDLIRLKTDWHMSDFTDLRNWGLLKGKPVILDYGYNEHTNMIYQNREEVDFEVYVEPTGAIRIKYKELEEIDHEQIGNR